MVCRARLLLIPALLAGSTVADESLPAEDCELEGGDCGHLGLLQSRAAALPPSLPCPPGQSRPSPGHPCFPCVAGTYGSSAKKMPKKVQGLRSFLGSCIPVSLGCRVIMFPRDISFWGWEGAAERLSRLDLYPRQHSFASTTCRHVGVAVVEVWPEAKMAWTAAPARRARSAGTGAPPPPRRARPALRGPGAVRWGRHRPTPAWRAQRATGATPLGMLWHTVRDVKNFGNFGSQPF